MQNPVAADGRRLSRSLRSVSDDEGNTYMSASVFGSTAAGYVSMNHGDYI